MKNAYKPFHRLKVYGDPVSVADILGSGRINAEGLTRFTEEIRIRILQLRDISERTCKILNFIIFYFAYGVLLKGCV